VIDVSKRDMYASVSKGAYVLEDAANAKVILIGTGSEVSVALGAREAAGRGGIGARVVSMPSWKILTSNRRSTRPACCRRACPDWRLKQVRRWDGGSMLALTAM